MTTHDDQDTATFTLKHLGPGVGSKVEQIKANSNYLRGRIAEELAEDSSHFSEDQVQLIKFHGMYQQEDRDARQARKAAGAEKAYQFMIRSRIPGGALTAEQYLVEDELADRYGNGSLRFTTRQSIQLHGVLKGNIRSVLYNINKSLLSTLSACGDVNRNVMACPAPIANRSQAQIQEIAHNVAMHLAPRSRAYHEIWIDGEKASTVGETEEDVEPMYGPTYLTRKFKVGIAYPGDNCIDVFTQDVGLVAKVEDDELVGFTVLVGGGMGATHGKAETYPRLGTPLGDITPDQVLKTVESVLTTLRDYGDRTNRKHARLKYVVEERGIEWIRAEVESRLGTKLSDPSPVHFDHVDDHLGWHQQADGRWFLGLHVVNGRVRDNFKAGLRRVVEHFRCNVRLTAWQNILLIDIPAEQRKAIEATLGEYGIAIDPAAAGTYRWAMACPALPTCGLAVAEAERVLPDVIKEIETVMQEVGVGGEPISIRMTGCPNGCARPYLGDIGLVGRSKGIYNLHLGGDWGNTRLTEKYLNNVRIENIASTLRPILALWKEERKDGETFGDFYHRLGAEELQARIAARQEQVEELHA
jgi:sulfite reductase (ferredoxin)